MPKQALSVRLDENLLREVDSLARNLRTTRSNVIEKVVAIFLEQDRIEQNAALKARGRRS